MSKEFYLLPHPAPVPPWPVLGAYPSFCDQLVKPSVIFEFHSKIDSLVIWSFELLISKHMHYPLSYVDLIRFDFCLLKEQRQRIFKAKLDEIFVRSCFELISILNKQVLRCFDILFTCVNYSSITINGSLICSKICCFGFVKRMG